MSVCAITITYNRLELTKAMLKSFYSKTKVDNHLFVDNGSTDGTHEYLLESGHDYIRFKENKGITMAFKEAIRNVVADGYDYLIKVDNDIEIVTQDIIQKMVGFFRAHGNKHVVAPIDLMINPNYEPHIFWEGKVAGGYDIKTTSHVGGAFMMMPMEIAERWMLEGDKPGDLQRGYYFQSRGYKPVYLKNLKIKHVGLSQSIKDYIL